MLNSLESRKLAIAEEINKLLCDNGMVLTIAKSWEIYSDNPTMSIHIAYAAELSGYCTSIEIRKFPKIDSISD